MSDSAAPFESARTLARQIRGRKRSALEVMRTFIARIERVNPRLNAIVTFDPERGIKAARALDRKLANARTAEVGPLAGLPIAHKDLLPTAGMRTTFGSRIYADNVPTVDHLIVERLRAAGAICIGKTNTPEFGAGSQTFNEVFGATPNPYDLTKTCGGSSGGAAVAVASGMLPFADGTDFAASLRNPGNFCNVVGFRPSTGRVPAYPGINPWSTMSEVGPIARTVSDTAFLLASMAGPDPRAPTSISEPGRGFARSLGRDLRKVRVAFSRSLGGLPVEPRVARVIEQAVGRLASIGCVVEEAEPDLACADDAFRILRALQFVGRYGELLDSHRAMLKDTVVWNIEEGLELSARDVANGEKLRAQAFHRLREFLTRYEFLVLPVNQVAPFPIDVPYPTEIAGTRMESYIAWMKTCYRITVTGHPAISVPAGFTDDVSPHGRSEGLTRALSREGRAAAPLPVGLQIVGRYRDDFGVLQLAHAFEATRPVWRTRPPEE